MGQSDLAIIFKIFPRFFLAFEVLPTVGLWSAMFVDVNMAALLAILNAGRILRE